MPIKLKTSKSLDVRADLLKASREVAQAGRLSETAHARLFAVYQALKFAKNQRLTPDGAVVLERTDRATNDLANAIEELRDAVHQVERSLQLVGG
jgi:signal transduction histidine kinase